MSPGDAQLHVAAHALCTRMCVMPGMLRGTAHQPCLSTSVAFWPWSWSGSLVLLLTRLLMTPPV